MSIRNVELVELPTKMDKRGSLTIIEGLKDIPFEIQCVRWIYGVSSDEQSCGYACEANEDFIVAVSGSFDVCFNDGYEELMFSLNCSCIGLYVPLGRWCQMRNFSTNSVALILSSKVRGLNQI